MPGEEYRVGSDVEALCNGCGDVWHVIVAKLGEKITKVECKQCGKQHRFKPTADAPAANLQPTRRVVAAKPVKPSSIGRPPAPRRGKPVFAIDPSKPLRPYESRASFAVDDQIDHPKFGQGIVRAVEPTKVRVEFADGPRTLLHRAGG